MSDILTNNLRNSRSSTCDTDTWPGEGYQCGSCCMGGTREWYQCGHTPAQGQCYRIKCDSKWTLPATEGGKSGVSPYKTCIDKGGVFNFNEDCTEWDACPEGTTMSVTEGTNITFGCTDINACNYLETNITDGNPSTCSYPETNYDCDGNCDGDMDDCGVCNGMDFFNYWASGNGIGYMCDCSIDENGLMVKKYDDCAGVCDGPAVYDDCGECGGSGKGDCGNGTKSCECVDWVDNDNDGIHDFVDDCVIQEGVAQDCGCNSGTFAEYTGFPKACTCEGDTWDDCNNCGGDMYLLPFFGWEECIPGSGTRNYLCNCEGARCDECGVCGGINECLEFCGGGEQCSQYSPQDCPDVPICGQKWKPNPNASGYGISRPVNPNKTKNTNRDIPEWFETNCGVPFYATWYDSAYEQAYAIQAVNEGSLPDGFDIPRNEDRHTLKYPLPTWGGFTTFEEIHGNSNYSGYGWNLCYWLKINNSSVWGNLDCWGDNNSGGDLYVAPYTDFRNTCENQIPGGYHPDICTHEFAPSHPEATVGTGIEYCTGIVQWWSGEQKIGCSDPTFRGEPQYRPFCSVNDESGIGTTLANTNCFHIHDQGCCYAGGIPAKNGTYCFLEAVCSDGTFDCGSIRTPDKCDSYELCSWVNPDNCVEILGPEHCCPEIGDLDGNGGHQVLDIVILAQCLLNNNCSGPYAPSNSVLADCPHVADINNDGVINVLDIVSLANIVLQRLDSPDEGPVKSLPSGWKLNIYRNVIEKIITVANDAVRRGSLNDPIALNKILEIVDTKGMASIDNYLKIETKKAVILEPRKSKKRVFNIDIVFQSDDRNNPVKFDKNRIIGEIETKINTPLRGDLLNKLNILLDLVAPGNWIGAHHPSHTFEGWYKDPRTQNKLNQRDVIPTCNPNEPPCDMSGLGWCGHICLGGSCKSVGDMTTNYGLPNPPGWMDTLGGLPEGAPDSHVPVPGMSYAGKATIQLPWI